MKKITALSAVCAIAISAYASDLGTIKVESSTIDDKFETKRSEVSSTSTVSGETVDKSHIENIQQILQSIPGVTTESSTGDTLKIHLRGVENQMYMGEKPGVAVVIDGVPVFERTGKVNIDLDNIESVKVIKGGASYLFGDDALSGAVIITTKRGAKYNHNYVAAEAGSFGYKKAVARTGYANDDLSFHVQASTRSADGYHEDSDYDTKYLNGRLQYYIDDTSDINFGVEYSEREKDSHGTVGGETQAKINPESIYTGDQDSRDYTRKYDVELMKAFLTYSKDLDDGANLLVNTYVYTDTTEFMSSPQTKDASGNNDATLTDDDYVYDNHYEQIQKGIKGEFRDSFESSAALLGVDLRANEYENKTTYRAAQALVIYGGPMAGVYPNTYQPGDFKSNDKTDENVYAIYGEYKYAFTNDFSATANLRYDKIKLDYTDSDANNFKKDFSVYSYRIGMNYQINQNAMLFTNFSTGFRAPTISQLFAGDVSAWGSTQNNTNLEPEESFNYEVGVRALDNGIKYEASVFQLDRKDFIMKTSGNYGDTDTNDMWDNVGGARHRGLELSTTGNLIDSLSFNMAYTYLRAKYTNYRNFGITMGADVYFPVFTPAPVMTYDVTGNTIPRTSKHTLNLNVDYKPMKELTLMSEVNARSKYYADDLNKIEIAGHATLNLMATYEQKFGMFDTSFFVRADNVFDKQYYTSARSSSDRNEDGVFNAEDLSITVNPGRVLTAGLSAKFLIMKKLLLILAFALCANASENLPIHILPHNCLVGQKAAKEQAGGHNHGGMGTAMYQLVGYNGSQDAKVTYTLSNLEQKDIKLKANMINLPKSKFGNYHAISAEVTDNNTIYGASYYIYKFGMPSKTSPTKLTDINKLTFEIKPNPLPREHDRYTASKEYTFLLTFKNKPVSADVKLTTHNGSELDLKSDSNGILEFTMPNDFKDVKNSRNANPASYFTLSSNLQDASKEYYTTLSMPYHVNPVNHWQSIPYGAFVAILGFLFGLFLYKRSKNG